MIHTHNFSCAFDSHCYKVCHQIHKLIQKFSSSLSHNVQWFGNAFDSLIQLLAQGDRKKCIQSPNRSNEQLHFTTKLQMLYDHYLTHKSVFSCHTLKGKHCHQSRTPLHLTKILHKSSDIFRPSLMCSYMDHNGRTQFLVCENNGQNDYTQVVNVLATQRTI